MSRRRDTKRPKQRGESPGNVVGGALSTERRALVPHPPRRRPWLLVATISLEIVWLAFLLVLALRS